MFFLFIFVLVVLMVVGLAIHTSKLGIEIENLKIDTEQSKGKKINKDSKIFIYVLIFNKIKLFKKDIKNDKEQSIKLRNKLVDIRLLKKKDLKIDYKEFFKNINIFIKEINLNVQLGTEDAALTALLTGAIAMGLRIIIRKPKYEVIPIYSGKNFLKIKLDCIFSVHLMQYIYKLIYKKIKDLGDTSLKKKVEV